MRTSERGFSLVEVMVAISLTVCLVMALQPLWVSVERTGAGASDRMVRLLQWRVAASRLQRDLRLATSRGCPQIGCTPLLHASASQLVIITGVTGDAQLELVEWEISGGSLMRRRGEVPATRPETFGHGLYFDHKSMLEGIESGGSFRYLSGAQELGVDPQAGLLVSIDMVELRLRVDGAGGRSAGPLTLVARGRVAR